MAAPVQSLVQSARANRLYQLVAESITGVYVSALLVDISLNPLDELVVDTCHLYSSVPVFPEAAELLENAAGTKPEQMV